MSELARVLEPEVMDDEHEAAAYDAMDHGGVNRRFVEDLLAQGPDLRAVLDVGTGTALIPIELLRQAPGSMVLAVDLASSMLSLGRENVKRAGFEAAILVEEADAKQLPHGDGAFSAVLSNSLLHHLPEPRQALAEMLRVLAPGGLLFVRDLVRPHDEDHLQQLVQLHAASDAPPQRKLFEDSLRAALSLHELQALASDLGLDPSCCSLTSDRHVTLLARV
ncbi:MAG: methyltransferase domain-containing protein [Polyangiaceae bacterium]|jgi:ubiquinone/menaquinone biosynthesis C-methylase UbiE|nr:methyltransferase domain-containing protein [Polyangiaceae bacterium]